MPTLADKDYFKLAVIFYGLSAMYSVFLWRKGFREDNRINYFLMLAAGIFNTTAMVKRGFSLSRCPVNNIFEAMMFVSWTIVAVYLAVGLFQRLRFLGAFAAPFLLAIGTFALMPALDVQGNPGEPHFENGWISLHAAVILLAYGAFGLSSIAGVMYLTQEHDLKFRKMRAVLSRMPSVERLERVTNRALLVGFVLLTIGLALVPVIVKQTPGLVVTGDPKVAWSIFVWALYLALLGWRWRFSAGGRAIAWGAIGSFCFVMLTFWGFTLLSPVHMR
ncbi:MAG TPA: cytochrome c biogenesis protein CcsA [Verrucomicrobiae bacterium]|nr:cytochrome c biogenesis protein CcsA [Verrucomicrobiae bacterium]